MKKYYWYCAEVTYKATYKRLIESGVLENEHPFEWENKVAVGDVDENVYDYKLLGWKEIERDEYLLYMQLNS